MCRCVAPSFEYVCVCVYMCVCVFLQTVFSSCVSLSTRLKQLLSSSFFSSSDASDLSCFSEPRQLYRCIDQLIMYINHQDILIYFVAKLLLYII